MSRISISEFLYFTIGLLNICIYKISDIIFKLKIQKISKKLLKNRLKFLKNNKNAIKTKIICMNML